MIEFRINEKTRSLNVSFRGDWKARNGIAQRQRRKAMEACPKWPGGPLLVVRLTRISPGTLDHANLAGALKHVQDGVASRLKVDDASPLVDWRFEQVKGAPEVVVQIWAAGEDAPQPPAGRPVERDRALPTQVESRLRAKLGVRSSLRAQAPAVQFEGSLSPPSTVKGKRKLSANYEAPRKPSGMGMHFRAQEYPGPIKRAAMAAREAVTRAAAESIAQATEHHIPQTPRGNRTNPMVTTSVVMSAEDSAIHRAVLAAQEAEAKFAPGPRVTAKEGEGCGNCEGIHPESCMFRSNH